jgi:MFS family permease
MTALAEALPDVHRARRLETMGRLLVLFVVAFVDTVGAALVVPILPFYATRFGATASTVGLLIAIFSVAQLVSAPAWGRVSDRHGRRPAIIGGLLITAASYALFAFAQSVPLLLLSRVVQGLGGGTIAVVSAYVADASPPEQRTRALGWLTAVTSLGWMSGAALGSVLVSVGGERAPGLFVAGFALVVAGFAWRFLAESREMRASGATVAPGTPAPVARTGLQAISHVLSRWREPAPRLIWTYAIGIGAFYGTVAVLPLLLADRLGVTEKTIGYYVMYFAGLGVVVRAGLLGRMVDWLGDPRLARSGIVLLAAGLILASFGQGYAVLFISFTLMPLGTAFLFPSVSGMLTRVVARHERGLYLGVQQTFGGAARVVFPVGAGVLMDRFGYGMPFLVSGILIIAMLPFAVRPGQEGAEPSG